MGKNISTEQTDWKKTAERVAHAMLHMKKDESMQEKYPVGLIDMDLWEWPQGVGLYGLMRFFQRTGDESIKTFLLDWMDGHISGAMPEHNVNTTIPCLAMQWLGEITGNERYLKWCVDWAEWIMHDLIRTGDGAFQHMITGDPNNGQILIDTLFMAVLFLVKMGRTLRREDYLQEAKRQILIHIKYLFDAGTGLFFHGYDFNGHHHYGAVRWARGNAWFTAVMAELLNEMDFEEGMRQYLKDTLLDQCRALIALQHPDGLWHTVLDDPTSYLETSASACITYGLLKGIHTGLLPGDMLPAAEKAVRGVIGRIDENGVVQGVSYGTPVGMNTDFYKQIPVCPMTYGQSLTLLMLTEIPNT